ncbi:hypothetical protein FIBSPDRAFT_1053462 [Athelia psychrophila]|uniref:Ubiquitin 3 binding protein But2 C-terminal domain-containing protein n=1 Tax=Athelia psychrophila TaxID=1759441 RepID=A0A167WXL5_9AGAM|nr:hypothetical protein FIBSPDRAFT_1053462 [Fibularhizoctonia sp. CBS 109695]
MKSIAASVLFVFLAISSATAGVAALPSNEPESTGHLARDSNNADASNTTAAGNGTLATGLGKYNCPKIDVSYSDPSNPDRLYLGFQYPEYDRTTNSISYSLAYDGKDCTMKIIHPTFDSSPYDGKYLRPSASDRYLSYYDNEGAIHCDLDVEANTLVLKNNADYRYGLGGLVNPTEGRCRNAYEIDSVPKAVVFNIEGDCNPVL